MNSNKFIPLCAALTATLLMCSASFANATPKAYYVSNSGNDNNPGTKTKPFKTVYKINDQKLNEGDTVYFHSGETFKGSLLFTGIAGTKQHPVIITSYGSGKAIIDAKDSVGIHLYKA